MTRALVRIKRELRINLSGYDREAVTLEPGDHVVPLSAARWLRNNPGYGEVLDDIEPAERPAAARLAAPADTSSPTPAEVSPSAAAADPAAEDLGALKVPELREHAAAAGVAGTGRMNRAQLLDALAAVAKAGG